MEHNNTLIKDSRSNGPTENSSIRYQSIMTTATRARPLYNSSQSPTFSATSIPTRVERPTKVVFASPENENRKNRVLVLPSATRRNYQEDCPEDKGESESVTDAEDKVDGEKIGSQMEIEEWPTIRDIIADSAHWGSRLRGLFRNSLNRLSFPFSCNITCPAEGVERVWTNRLDERLEREGYCPLQHSRILLLESNADDISDKCGESEKDTVPVSSVIHEHDLFNPHLHSESDKHEAKCNSNSSSHDNNAQRFTVTTSIKDIVLYDHPGFSEEQRLSSQLVLNHKKYSSLLEADRSRYLVSRLAALVERAAVARREKKDAIDDSYNLLPGQLDTGIIGLQGICHDMVETMSELLAELDEISELESSLLTTWRKLEAVRAEKGSTLKTCLRLVIHMCKADNSGNDDVAAAGPVTTLVESYDALLEHLKDLFYCIFEEENEKTCFPDVYNTLDECRTQNSCFATSANHVCLQTESIALTLELLAKSRPKEYLFKLATERNFHQVVAESEENSIEKEQNYHVEILINGKQVGRTISGTLRQSSMSVHINESFQCCIFNEPESICLQVLQSDAGLKSLGKGTVIGSFEVKFHFRISTTPAGFKPSYQMPPAIWCDFTSPESNIRGDNILKGAVLAFAIVEVAHCEAIHGGDGRYRRTLARPSHWRMSRLQGVAPVDMPLTHQQNGCADERYTSGQNMIWKNNQFQGKTPHINVVDGMHTCSQEISMLTKIGNCREIVDDPLQARKSALMIQIKETMSIRSSMTRRTVKQIVRERDYGPMNTCDFHGLFDWIFPPERRTLLLGRGDHQDWQPSRIDGLQITVGWAKNVARRGCCALEIGSGASTQPDNCLATGNRASSIGQESTLSYVEVACGQIKVQTPRAKGQFPMWKHSFCIPLPSWNKSKDSNGEQCCDAILSFTLLDEHKFDFPYLCDFDEGEDTHKRDARFLGQLSIPLKRIWEDGAVEGVFLLDSSDFYLGYDKGSVFADNTCRNPDIVGGGTNLMASVDESAQVTVAHEEDILNRVSFAERQLLKIAKEGTYLKIRAAFLPPPSDSCAECCESFMTTEDEELVDYASRWRSSLGVHRSAMKARYHRVLIPDSHGAARLVTRFLKSQEPPPEVKNSLESCAHFVSLIPLWRECQHLTGDKDIWCTNQEFIDLLAGNVEDHAVLLANFFLNLGECYPDRFAEEVYLAIGQSAIDGNTVAVLRKSIRSGEIVLWDATRAKSYHKDDELCPIDDISILVSQENIFGNLQTERKPFAIDFDVSNCKKWRPFYSERFPPPSSPLAPVHEGHLTYGKVLPGQSELLQNQIVDELKQSFRTWRSHATCFNAFISKSLLDIIDKLEQTKLNGIPLDHKQYRESFGVGTKGKSKIGVPMHFPHTGRLEHILQKVKSTEVHTASHPEVEFALGVKVFPYSCGIFSIWIFLSAIWPT